MSHLPQAASTIMTILSESHSHKRDERTALCDMLCHSHAITSLSGSDDSDSYTTDNYHTSTSLSGGHESEGLYIYLSKERDIYQPPLTLTTDSHPPLAVTPDCGIFKNPQGGKLTVIEPEPMTQEEWEAIQAQAALDDAADAQALWQLEETKRLAQERASAFIAAHHQAHTTIVAIFHHRQLRPCLVQYEGDRYRMLAIDYADGWRSHSALDSASLAIMQASG
jgi:hypothetical protein